MLCFFKFPLAKKFMDKRGGGGVGEEGVGSREYQDFPSKIFFSQYRKIS